MTKKILTLIIAALLGSLMISSCTSSTLMAATSWPGMTADADNEMVYLSAGSQVYAISTKNGSEVWRYPDDVRSDAGRGITFFAAPAIANDLIVVGDYKSSIHAIEADSGKEEWLYLAPKDKFVGQAAFADDMVFVPSADYHIYALDLDGDLQFRVETEKSNWASVVANGSSVYAPSMDHFIYAFDAATGDIDWQTDVEGAVAAAPVLENGILYIATLNMEAIALDTTDGSILWRTDVEDFTWAGPTVVGDLVVVINSTGDVFALNKEDGSIAWTADANGEVTAAAVAVDGGFIVVNHNMDIILFDLEGAKVWSNDLDFETGTLPSTPAVVGDLILIPVAQSTEALLVAFDVNGNQIWDFVPEQ
ncbi:MAG: PQQ-binding-like beta-propeller repeat protein [Anaerolineae bacterium]|jgi:outer membrane protein assembly factor BamB|nr:PQQ-binding-like beta-propeller repeat protein [Anaerolineae bacterium]